MSKHGSLVSKNVTCHVSRSKQDIARLLCALGWEERYIDGQREALAELGGERSPGTVFVATIDGHVAGYISVAFYRWNRLGQIHGLVGILHGCLEHRTMYSEAIAWPSIEAIAA